MKERERSVFCLFFAANRAHLRHNMVAVRVAEWKDEGKSGGGGGLNQVKTCISAL